MGWLSICLLILFTMFHSLQCTSLLSPWLSVFPKYFIGLDAIVNEIVFLISISDGSLLVYRIATNLILFFSKNLNT